ncbi:MAG TPA: LruC domain-containing protein [Chitinophagaceae bacterium]|nr:LruC domain-containing protein [Chitinophagaceae bacterium]
MKNQIFTLCLFVLALAFSCKKAGDQPAGGNTGGNTGNVEKIAPDGFTFSTAKTVSVNIQLLAPDNTPIAGVPVSIYDAAVTIQDNGNAQPGAALFTGLSDKNGYVKASLAVAATLDTVLVDAKYTSLPQNAKAYINGTSLDVTLGGTDGIGGNVVPNLMVARGHAGMPVSNSFLPTTNYVSMGNTDHYGRPKYLVTPDVISSTLLSYINASLPEGIPLTTTHPQYLTDAATGTVNVTEKSDVWITFVSEGAGYANSLGYYTYPTNNPPQSPSDISTVYVALPNASLYGSGGTMRSGDKIKLGTFDAGTSIGFVLFQDAWESNSSINTSATKFYSDTKLNPEDNSSYKKHSVLLYDGTDELYLVGFEDLQRPDGDNDFNDIVFYATSNPVTGISNAGVEPIDKPIDTDGDGVSDVFDQYPKDAARAYDNYYPSQNSYATLAFEDLWPSTGDYDMNDLVVNYRYKFVSNASNNVVEVYGDYAVQAAGASFQNGFGVQFPFAANLVKSVTGQKLKSNYITTAANGVEAGQSKAVIIPFDNHQDLINNYAGAYFINTKNELPKVTGDTAHVYLQFTSPISSSTLGSAPFNPFLISNMRREYEVHLPGNAPTDKANAKLLATGDDASVPASGIYYVSKSNWPWAISFTTQFTYPLEGVKISDAYLHFLDWAKSGGTSYTDWLTNSASDYRNNSNLYTK